MFSDPVQLDLVAVLPSVAKDDKCKLLILNILCSIQQFPRPRVPINIRSTVSPVIPGLRLAKTWHLTSRAPSASQTRGNLYEAVYIGTIVSGGADAGRLWIK
jgi:hypothetical protein